MKPVLIVFVLICTNLLFFSSCKSKHFTPYDYEGEIIRFGQGGGFTGQVTEFTLLSNGQLFKGTNKEGNVFELNRLESDEVEQVFTNYRRLQLDTLDLNRPGNLYSYIIHNNGPDEHKIQWGAHDFKTPKELSTYFSILMRYAKDKNKQY